RGDRLAAGVPLDEGALGDGQVQKERVDEQKIRRRLQLFDSEFHSQPGSMINIDAVDSGGVDGRDGPSDGPLANTLREDRAPLRIQLLAVVEPANGPVLGQDHSGGEYRAKQGSAADFIDAGHEAKSSRSHLALDPPIAADPAG